MMNYKHETMCSHTPDKPNKPTPQMLKTAPTFLHQQVCQSVTCNLYHCAHVLHSTLAPFTSGDMAAAVQSAGLAMDSPDAWIQPRRELRRQTQAVAHPVQN